MSDATLINAILARRRAYGGGGGGGIVDGTSAAAALASLPASKREELLADLAAGVLEPGDILRLNDAGTGIEGLDTAPVDVATQADVLAGIDTNKALTAEAAGGFHVQRAIPYAPTLTVDFSGDAPVWGARNVVPDVSGAVVLQADTFPEYTGEREFGVRFVRASGSGAITLQDNEYGTTVEYRDGLTAGDMPELSAVPGDWVEVRGKVIGTDSWCVMGFASRTAAQIDISGGTITTPEGFKVATFTESGTLTVTGGGTLNYELAAGGGAAGNGSAGAGGSRNPGGGAGDVLRGSIVIGPGTYAVEIGAGGVVMSGQPGGDGEATTALGLTAAGGGGGGGGGSAALADGRPGGSGSGAAGWGDTFRGTGGASTANGLGNAGGNGGGSATTTNRRGGGGGGAGGAGAAGVASTFDGGQGGTGSASIAPGVSATYAVGGDAYRGAAPSAPTAPGSGGHGGAGAGGANGTDGVAGIAHFWISAS